MELLDIKGLGEKTIKLLDKLGISTIDELVSYYPFRYEVLKIARLNECINESGLLNVQILDNPKISYFNKKFNRLCFRVICEGKIINVVIFNRGFLKRLLVPGKYISIIGKYDVRKNLFTASDIKMEMVTSSRIEPVYHSKGSINSKQIHNIMLNVLESRFDVSDYAPSVYCNRYGFISKKEAIKEIHNPSSIELLKKARLKLIYEEFFVFMFKMNYLKVRRESGEIGVKRNVKFDDVLKFIETLPFKLTDDQYNTVCDIYSDLTTQKRMNRLVLGDVGSGKTIVSVIAMVINAMSGYQSVLMAPTEVLARQHYENICKLVPDFKVGLLVGSMKKKEKNEVIKGLVSGEISILIGTHALLSDNVVFKNLGLVVTDEQHRFGVNQRQIMQNKGVLVDVIYMSATPIPRTYALSLYGDMDLSMIKTKPSGRKEIITRVVAEENIKEVLIQCLEELKKNHQIYVVAPLITDDDNELNDVYKLQENFTKAFAGKVRVDVLHGKMKKDDKNRVMDDFKSGVTKILVSTTVIEVGVDVKNSTMMIIYNADRFGLATLHQLRGRVGRNDYQCYCYLIAGDDVPRLKVLEESNDGFYISEKDFQMRGEGDLFGVKQSGDMHFAIGDLKHDIKILMQCKNDAYEYLKNFDNNEMFLEIINQMKFNN